mmetsp:Transcript_10528/g.27304  ORF Transcript_10528/g.27304 Transcript_10528/m.27304 type:complete len:205 (+) Transcript_10528:243-857(+)
MRHVAITPAHPRHYLPQMRESRPPRRSCRLRLERSGSRLALLCATSKSSGLHVTDSNGGGRHMSLSSAGAPALEPAAPAAGTSAVHAQRERSSRTNGAAAASAAAAAFARLSCSMRDAGSPSGCCARTCCRSALARSRQRAPATSACRPSSAARSASISSAVTSAAWPDSSPSCASAASMCSSARSSSARAWAQRQLPMHDSAR